MQNKFAKVISLNACNHALGFRTDLEVLRGLCILLVVLSHDSGLSEPNSAPSWLKYLFLDSSAWFIFLSGYFFARIDLDHTQYKLFLLKKCSRLFYPYFFWVSFGIVIGLLLGRAELTAAAIFYYALWSFYVGGAIIYPLWFLPVIFICYLCTPVIRKASKNFLFGYLVSFFVLISLLTFRPSPNLNPIQSFIHFFGCYLVGVTYFRTEPYWENLFRRSIGRSLVFSMSALGCAATYLAAERNNYDQGFLLGLGSFNYLRAARYLFIPLAIVVCRVSPPTCTRPLCYLSRISLPLFMVHGVFSITWRVLHRWSGLDVWWPLSAFCEFVFVMGLSIGTIESIRKISQPWSERLIGR